MTPRCGQLRPKGQDWQDIRSVWWGEGGEVCVWGGGAIANMHCYILDNYCKMWVSWFQRRREETCYKIFRLLVDCSY